ncbi:MAG: type transport system ATP-binding protein [Actinomycetota bacterium]|nr:type transport system ATP-binding protein [Actinomycetota bacterium]
MSDSVISLRSVSRSFGDVVALDEFSLEVPAGTIAMLLGPNGAGKTTAVRLVTGAMPADAGALRIFGSDPVTDGESVRRRCGVVPARPALYDRLSGYENLRYAALLWDVVDIDGAIHIAASRFGIVDALAQRVGGYSTGMKARLALARATLHEPDLLLLDEPTAGLDPESARSVLALIGEMAHDGRTVLMCTHLLLEAEGLADHVVVMDHGHTLASGSPRDLVRRLWTSVTVALDAEDPTQLDQVRTMPGVVSYQRANSAVVGLDDADRVPELVAALVAKGVRLTRVEPRTPTLEELYFAVRRGTHDQPTEPRPVSPREPVPS